MQTGVAVHSGNGYDLAMKRCVMFDFDGVIVDSERYALDLLRRMLREQYSLEITEEDGMHVIGYSTVRTIGYINDKYGSSISVDDFTSRYPLYTNFYVDYEGLRPIDHAIESITAIASYGYKTGLVTSTRSMHILYALDRMRMLKCFDFVVTGDMIKNSKPDPEPYLKGVQFSGFAADECVAVEDSPAGVRAAKGAGLFTVGFKAASIKLDTSAADAEAASYAELEALLRKMAEK